MVTGASQGIGLAIARALAGEGVSVVAGALSGSAELDELTTEADVHAVHVDLTTTDGPRELIETAASAWGGIDILVNNVGAVRPRLEGFLALTDEDWEWALTINFLAAVRTMRAAIPHLSDRPDASIVTICSVNAFLPDPGVIDYSAAKAALTNLCKSLSKELGPGIRVNTISPGPVAHRPVAGQPRGGRHRRRSHRDRPRTTSYAAKRPRRRPDASPPERSRRPRPLPGQRPVGQHHRQRLRHRRRADHDAVSAVSRRAERLNGERLGVVVGPLRLRSGRE